MEKNEFKALVERYKNEMIELFNLKEDNLKLANEHIIENNNDENNEADIENNIVSDVKGLESYEDSDEDQNRDQDLEQITIESEQVPDEGN